jgi:ABC-type lipoprotein release transport system permease subunit
MGATPEEVFFGEDVYIISQASSGSPVTYELVEMLRSQEWVDAVSPEVYAFIAIRERAVVVRGIEPAAFALLEGLTLPGDLGEEFLLVGERLASRLGVQAGDSILLPGSLRPLLMEVTVDGILHADGALGDEVLMDLPRARRVAGLSEGSIILIRVRVGDGQRLVEYLASQRADVVVGKEGSGLRVEDGQVVDDRIGALLLTRPELARELGRSYVASFARYSGNSLRVLVLGMGILTGALFLIILSSSVVRFLVERRRDVGLVLALGGGLGALFSAWGRRILTLGLLSGVLGILVGILTGELLERAGTFTLFGHLLAYEVDLWTFLTILLLYAAALVLSVIMALLFLRGQQPRDLLYEAPQRIPVGGEEGGV